MNPNLRPAPPFKKGESGNPNGRPLAAFRASQAARAKANVYRQWLEAIAKGSEKDADRINAIKVLLTIASGEALRVKLADVDDALEKMDMDKALEVVAKQRRLKLVPMTPAELEENHEQERETKDG